MEIITTLETLCSNCGFFDNDAPVNNGYGCSHKECEDGEFMKENFTFLKNATSTIAKSFSKRKISCNRRLGKKFIKQAMNLSDSKRTEILEKLGYMYYGKCYSFSCPISYEVSFESISQYKNGKDYIDIETEEDMPEGFGDELMSVDIKEADRMGIDY